MRIKNILLFFFYLYFFYSCHLSSVTIFKNSIRKEQSGDTLKIFRQKKGIKSGIYKLYIKNKLSIRGHYKNGVKSGKWYFYNENGLAAKSFYKNGELIKQKLINQKW